MVSILHILSINIGVVHVYLVVVLIFMFFNLTSSLFILFGILFFLVIMKSLSSSEISPLRCLCARTKRVE